MVEQTRSSITVSALLPDVMAVIANFAAYPDWASVKRAEVLDTCPDGRARSVRFTLDAGVIRDIYTLGYTWRGDEQVSWTLAEHGSMITAMDGSYTLTEQSAGTVVTYQLTVDVKMPMIGVLKRKAERVIVDTALGGLRRRVEG